MNKGDLVNEVAKVVGTKKEAKAAVDCVFQTITKALKKKGYGYTGGLRNFQGAEKKGQEREKSTDRGRDQNQGEEGP